MHLAVDKATRCALCRRRRPERTPLYRAVQGHLETYLALAREGQGEGVPGCVEREYRRDLECGILAHGFARARWGQCGHDFLIAFSCKGCALCPSCKARRSDGPVKQAIKQCQGPRCTWRSAVQGGERACNPLDGEPSFSTMKVRAPL